MLKKFDFVFDYKENSILLLSDSNKALLKIEGEAKEDIGGSVIRVIWSVIQIILLILVKYATNLRQKLKFILVKTKLKYFSFNISLSSIL